MHRLLLLLPLLLLGRLPRYLPQGAAPAAFRRVHSFCNGCPCFIKQNL
jgi:hypothetical protein